MEEGLIIRGMAIIRQVQWKGFPSEDATWEGEQNLQHPGLLLLEDKQTWEGRIVMSLP